MILAYCLATALSAPSPAGPASAPLNATQPFLLESLPHPPGSDKVQQGARLVDDNQPAAALTALGALDSPAADLVRARAQRLLGKLLEAQEALARAGKDPALAPLVQLELGRLAAAGGNMAVTVQQLLPLLDQGGALATQAVGPLVDALSKSDPNALLSHAAALTHALPKDDLDARSLLIEAQAVAQDALGQPDAARATRLQRYLEEPVSVTTPATPPVGTQPTSEQLLQRGERLIEAHRNERAIPALEAVPDAGLPADQLCRKHFALGLASRKVRKYAPAEEHLAFVVSHCESDEDLTRRAAYLRAKVISIRDGLRAIPAIEDFARRYPAHTMTDDVLFWAGDLYQRRNRDNEALTYYARIDALPVKDDQCAEARWRIAWMAYRRNDLPTARAGLQKFLQPDGCTVDIHEQSRARYWLARIAEQDKKPKEASELYRAVLDSQPLGFYAQQALPRLLKLQTAKEGAALSRTLLAPSNHPSLPLCPDWLAQQPAFGRGLTYLEAGLGPDAAAEFRTLEPPEQDVMGQSHAVSLGVQEKAPTLQSPQSLEHCGRAQAALLLVLLLDHAGAQHDAHWRLRTEFGDEFNRFPTAKEMVLWRAAYPLAFRELIAPAEVESHLPAYSLQSLAREESAFDPKVVSWAEAYGLTQLVLASGQGAGKQLKPKVTVQTPEQLLDPALNVRLGGALLSSLVRRYSGNLGLALAGYNAGEDVATAWWKRYAGQDFAIYAEEMTIQETRGYVKRVLRTYGIYRWLYAAALPTLPVELTLPPRS